MQYDQARRATRLLLDIHAQTPIIVIPINKLSDELLVLKLGDIKINNKFLVDGETGTLNSKQFSAVNTDDVSNKSTCLLDVISIQFTDTDVYSAIRYDVVGSSAAAYLHDSSIR